MLTKLLTDYDLEHLVNCKFWHSQSHEKGCIMLEEMSQKKLRQLQLLENDILIKVVEICKKYGLQYYLSSGTLLGAVRHQGFIPWDDDIDIEIPIDDFRQFLKVAQSELGDEYFLQTYVTDPNYHFAYAQVRKNNTTFLDPYNYYYKIHHGVSIDVFPMVPVNDGIRLFLKQKWISASNFVQIQEKINTHKDEFQRLLGPVGMWVMKMSEKIPMSGRQKIHKMMLDVVFNAKEEKCKYYTNVWGNITRIIPKEAYDGKPSKVPFEGHMYDAPHDYDCYLKIAYGNYMELPPEEERIVRCSKKILDFENSYEKYVKY